MGIWYRLGVDSSVCSSADTMLISSRTGQLPLHQRRSAFYANMLLLRGVVGAFMALDMFLFFVFFE